MPTFTGAITSGGVITVAGIAGGTIPNGGGVGVSLAVQYSPGLGPGQGGGYGYLFNEFGPLNVGFNGGSVIISVGGLTPGTYTNIPLTSVGSCATGVQATVVVNGAGNIASVTITNGGSMCVYADAFTFPTTSMGGSFSPTWAYNVPGNACLNAPGTISIDAYGTGGTSGTGGNGTYQMAGTVGAAQNPGAAADLSSGNWVTTSGGGPGPSVPSYAPPPNTPEPLPTYNLLQAFEAVTFPFAPPTPLPQTATGTNTTTSYSS